MPQIRPSPRLGPPFRTGCIPPSPPSSEDRRHAPHSRRNRQSLTRFARPECVSYFLNRETLSYVENAVQEPTFEPVSESPPRTTTVVCMLVAAALILSYLWAYAVTNALIAAEVISRWPPGSDPRPLRMCVGFITL